MQEIVKKNPDKFQNELSNVPAWIVEQMTMSERAAFAKWYDKVCNEIEANKLGDTLKNV